MCLKKVLSSFVIFITCSSLIAQNKYISGFVRDSVNGEKLINVYVISNDQKYGTLSNNEGYFTIRLPEDKNEFTFSHIGYSTKTINFTGLDNSLVTVELSPNLTLKDVVIKGRSLENSRFRNFAITEIPIDRIKIAPVMLGEADLFKTIQLFPGVTTTWPGLSGIVVRGGNSDQNLILLDDIPLYSFSHFYGLFSVINENALQSVRFMKGAIPARFGGRLSSVVDVTLKEGNKKKIEGEVGMGLMSSSFLINGPLKNKKTVFSLSGRRSMSDLVSVPISWISNKQKLGSFFTDFSGKITHSFSQRDLVSVSVLRSLDKFYNISTLDYTNEGKKGKLTKDEGYKWGDNVLSIKHNRIQSPVITINNTVSFSNFFHERHITNTYKEGDEKNKNEVIFSSEIKDIGIRTDWQYTPTHSMRFFFGVCHTLHQFKPGISNFYSDNLVTGDTVFNSIGNKPIKLPEFVGYLEYDFRVLRLLTFNFGMRATLLNMKDTIMFFPEPRLSGTFNINTQVSTTFFYTHTNQYFHFLRSSALDQPTDLWIPASRFFPSEKAQQSGIEIDYKVHDAFEISIAAYFKKMQNLVLFKEGSSIIPENEDLKDNIESGTGTGYGVEFFAEKSNGKINGFLSYTLSWSRRKFPNINHGKEFYSSFDRRHELSVTANYNLNKEINFSFNWHFNTGTPYSMPSYQIPPVISGGTSHVYVYQEKNTFRLPSFHRLDIGLYYIKPVKKHPGRQRIWSASVYNVYNKKNSYYRGILYGYGVEANMFLFLPSISYKLKF